MMHYEYILIRYGELSLKGKNRKLFIQKLHENVKEKLRDIPEVKIKQSRDRMFILLNGMNPEPIIVKCKTIFGIQSLSLAIKVENEEQKIKQAALFALQEAKDVNTFKVTVKRVNKNFPIDSQKMNQLVGKHLLIHTNDITVDVHHPDMEVHVEIRNEATYITSKRILGAGGLPVGTSGKSLLLMSGGIDSPVAGYLTMKRGVALEVIHFHSPPYTSDRAKQKVIDLTQKLTSYGHRIRVHIVPFTNLQQKIHREIPHGYSMTVMRRMMLRISEAVANKEGILSLTTGENLGQVASQTMESMHSINAVTSLPIIRPLITMDKEEIIAIAQQIDTYNISIRPFEDCCTIFVPKTPKTRPKLEKVMQHEGFIDFTADLESTIANMETIDIYPTSRSSDEFSNLL